VLPNLEKRRILDRAERGILDARTAVGQKPAQAAPVPQEAVGAFSGLLARGLGAPRRPPRSGPRLNAKQVAGHVFDANQNSALSGDHQHRGRAAGADTL
jgi:hypothetical protein